MAWFWFLLGAVAGRTGAPTTGRSVDEREGNVSMRCVESISPEVISRKKHSGIRDEWPLLPKELLPLQGGGWEGDGAKGQISSLPDYPIPTPTRPIANVAGATFPLKGRERVPRSGKCIAGNHLTEERFGIEKKRQEGRQEGEVALLQGLLVRRFGLPPGSGPRTPGRRQQRLA
jgi:hypothetical protein